MNNKLSQLFLNEWRSIFANRTIVLVMLIVPLLYTTLFGFLYSERKVMELPTVVLDADQSELSRELIRAFDQDQTFAVSAMVDSEAELSRRIDAGEDYVGIIIPAGLSDKLKRGQQTEVLTIIDGSNLMISNTAVRAASTIVKTVSAGVTLKQLEAKGEWGEQGKSFLTGIDYRYRVLYNPTFSYLSFMVFGLGGTVLQQVVFLGIAIAVTREKEAGTWQQTIREHSFGQLLAGKMLPYLILSTFSLLITYTLLLKGFQIPSYGNPLWLMLAGIIFNVAVLALGLAISFFSPNQLQATQVAMLIAVPSFMLSGYTWPTMSMTPVIAGISQSLPLTYFLHAVREILTKGHGFDYIRQDLLVLCLMAIIGIFAAFLAYLWNRKRAIEPVENLSTMQNL
ncbi:ABC transporter permease [Brevibacillus sp. B_LB10_24]|uniref:ABC transporter permease n=1 Tax=Brevibacillus sp. B_LB10_24 TaxID=3380645 RepID=UPI0038BB3D1A